MIKIAHRGNINGPLPKLENSPGYILEAIKEGYDVEVDLWFKDNNYYLGHDEPNYMVGYDFLISIMSKSWFHCKNFDALNKVRMIPGIKYFWHQNDDYTLTSTGHIWTYPGKSTYDDSIIVDLSKPPFTKEYNCFGICSDYVGQI